LGKQSLFPFFSESLSSPQHAEARATGETAAEVIEGLEEKK
jgi:hypothetical protein